MSLFNKHFEKELPYHLLLWVLLIGPHSFFSAYLIDEHLDLLIYCVVVADGLLIAMVYFIIYVLIEKHHQRGHYTLFVLWLVLLSTGYILACLKMETDISDVLGREDRIVHYAVYYFVNFSRYTLIGFLSLQAKAEHRATKKIAAGDRREIARRSELLKSTDQPAFPLQYIKQPVWPFTAAF